MQTREVALPVPRPLRPGEPDRFGDYRVLGQLGQGGQGTVYLAESPTGERVAIKVLHAHHAMDEDVRRRFMREVTAARQVATFSTARVIEVNKAGDRPYIVSEYIDGASLEQRVRELGPLSGDELVRLALGTVSVLAAIHGAGIIHRDFKPSNVVLGPDGPRVIDFGIARALDSRTAGTSGLIGTPAYMAPEQIANEPPGPSADVFSWAATMVFAATGRPAFDGASLPAILHAVLATTPDLSGLPPTLRSLLERCLAKSPQDRPTAADIMLQLVGHGAEPPRSPTATPAQLAPPSTDPPGSPDPEPDPAYESGSIATDATGPSRRRTRRVGVAAVSVLLALAVSAGLWRWTTSTAPSGTVSYGGAGSPSGNGLKKVGIAYDIGGRGDLWFNDSAAMGLDRARNQLGLSELKELEAVENEPEAKKEERLRTLAEGGYDPVVAIGYAYSDSLKNVAPEFPHTRFAIIDSSVPTGTNISNLLFSEPQAGYLAGAAAALASKSGHVGFVGAVEDDPIVGNASAGFAAGAKSIKTDIKIDIRFVSRAPNFTGYNDPAKAKTIAADLFAAGTDVVFQAAGGSNPGIMAAAKAAGSHVIGAEADEARTAAASLRGLVLTSVIKRVDSAVFGFLRDYSTGSARSGRTVYDMRDAGIDYTTTNGQIDGITARLDEIKRKIADGEITVPVA